MTHQTFICKENSVGQWCTNFFGQGP